MTDLRQRAERIAKKLIWHGDYDRTVVALEEMAAEVRREAIEECAPYMRHRLDCRVRKAWTDEDKCDCGLRALLPAEKEPVK